MKTSQEKYHVISPDGFPITPEPFPSKSAAEAYMEGWCAQFKHQGYYAGVNGRIPLAELPGRLVVVPESQTFTTMGKVLDNLNGVDAIDNLMDRARFHADEALHCGGEIIPTLYLQREDETCTGYSLARFSEDNAELVSVARQMCMAEGAVAAVICTGAWMRRDSDSREEKSLGTAGRPPKDEAVILLGESRERNFQRVLPILRMDDGQYFRFDQGFDLEKEDWENRIENILTPKAPTEEAQREAKSQLEAKGILPLTHKKRGHGREIPWF
jgi:hypothetical protein